MQIILEFVTGQDKKGEDIIIKKTFTAKIKARTVREALELTNEVDLNDLTPEDLDKVIIFICSIYNNKFTIDEFYDGLGAENLMETLVNSIEGVINGVTKILNTFPSK